MVKGRTVYVGISAGSLSPLPAPSSFLSLPPLRPASFPLPLLLSPHPISNPSLYPTLRFGSPPLSGSASFSMSLRGQQAESEIQISDVSLALTAVTPAVEETLVTTKRVGVTATFAGQWPRGMSCTYSDAQLRGQMGTTISTIAAFEVIPASLKGGSVGPDTASQSPPLIPSPWGGLIPAPSPRPHPRAPSAASWGDRSAAVLLTSPCG